jgi:hypothetical protein
VDLKRKHIAYRISIVLLVTVLITPSFVKFSQFFDTHIHLECKNSQQIHFHEFDINCDFYKFKLNTQFSFFSEDFQYLNKHEDYKIVALNYSFLSNYQPLSFLLRGPPHRI